MQRMEEGVYVPPFKLSRMLKEAANNNNNNNNSLEYQRLTWDALKKSINGLINKVNATNIKNIIPELFAENLIRGRGLFCRCCIKSQMASPGFTDVFAALEEAGHKLLKIKLQPGQEMELCIMLLECCSQERTYRRFYGLLGQRLCLINEVYQQNSELCFVQQYSMVHRLETNKIRNVATFFSHLLGTDALPWHALAYIRLTEEATTSSSRIFVKFLFLELSEHLGIRLLNERLSDPTMQDSFESIFPRDNPRNTRFSINFFTSIGLGGITENMREYLKDTCHDLSCSSRSQFLNLKMTLTAVAVPIQMNLVLIQMHLVLI